MRFLGGCLLAIALSLALWATLIILVIGDIRRGW